MIKPSVSVIIPFYSDVKWLCEAVESFLKQTYPIAEIIVVNDGSKEDDSSFLRIYGNRIKYYRKENGGPATARNLGLEKATSDYVAFLDSDDLWLPEKTELQINEMLLNKAVWSHTAYETFDTNSGLTLNTISVKDFNGMIFPKMVYSNPLATPGIIISREILTENPSWRFNNEMRYGQDQYLWMCIAPKYKILAIDKVLVKVRMRGGNASLRARVQLRARAIIYRNVLLPHSNYLKSISWSGRVAFEMCTIGEKVLSLIEKNTENNNIIENVSRVLYLIPWLLFKFNSKRS